MQSTDQSLPNIEINQQFERALKLMKQGDQHLFITGKAGTGKSTLLDYFCRQYDKRPVVLAPTGVAALNVGGQTIHSFFNFYVDVTPQKILDKTIKPRAKKIYKTLKTLIIDEVSMLRADLLDCIDAFLRLYGKDSDKPFGGVQLILVGDLYQLPPVVTKDERHLFTQHYDSPYFFSAIAFKQSSITVIELEKVYRQKEQNFVALLNSIRNNKVDADTLRCLNQRYLPDHTIDNSSFYISLTTTNKRAEEINEQHLEDILDEEHESEAEIKGDFSKEYYPTSEVLQYKVGAQIMMLNNDQKRRWVNGSIGIIESVNIDLDGEPYLRVKLQASQQIALVHRFTWEVFKFKTEGNQIVSEPVGSFTQFPFRLAWAVTIHKSQGKTFDNVMIDLGRGTFVTGQLYVALSRCTTFEGVILKTQVKRQHIQVDSKVRHFLAMAKFGEVQQPDTLADKLAVINEALDLGVNLKILYKKLDNGLTERIIKPQSISDHLSKTVSFKGLKAFCLKRQGVRVFRVDRILSLHLVDELAVNEG